MAKANKSVKTAGKAASMKPGKTIPKSKPVLRSIKGGKNGGKSAPVKPGAAKASAAPAAQSKTAMMKAISAAPAVADDVPVIALNLEPVKLSPAMAAYF